MIKSIEIENLRGIQNGKLEDFTPLTILVGPNSSGKSTVLDAMYLGVCPNATNVLNHLRNREKLKSEVRWLIFLPLKNKRAFVKVQTVGFDELTETREFVLSLKLDGDQQTIDVQSKISTIKDSIQHDGESKYFLYIADGSSGNTTEDLPGAGVKEISYLSFDNIHTAPTLVDLYSKSIELGRRTAAQKALNEVLPGLIHVEIGTYKDKPRLLTVYEDRSVPLASEGDGIQSLMRLSLSLSACAEGTVLMEEPEVHQHPRALRMSAKAILSAVNRGVQVVLSTHSLELIDALLSEAKSADSLEKVSICRLLLKDGCLKHYRSSGVDAEFQRFEIEDDLR